MCALLQRVRRHKLLALGVTLVLASASVAAYLMFFGMGVPEARELRQYVRATPPVRVVFTSRSEPTSLVAAAPEGEGFSYPGTIPWAATEGRLRLLDTDGKVYELTWGRELPGGGTLIDVMSPSITLDGKRILFAGRKAPPDPGRWRIFEVGIDGRNLRQVTGGPDDPGCVELPPLRYGPDGTVMDPEARKRLDYDDVDPVDQGMAMVFASSRAPDLGRDHTRRATQIWIWPQGEPKPRALSANRNNDRWPYMTFAEEIIVFSMWSRNREAVTADQTDVRPVSSGGTYATAPTDVWVGMRVRPPGEQFGYAVKIPEPVWRPRPLFNGRLAFMTAHPAGSGRLRLAQADWGYLRLIPSAYPAGETLPHQSGGRLLYGPDRDAAGRELTAACPSPCPGERVLFAAAPVGGGPGEWGLYHADEDWSKAQTPELLFDDPRLVDAEPVAIYRRPIEVTPAHPHQVAGDLRPQDFRLANSRPYTGEFGELKNSIINTPMPDSFPGQQTDTGHGPLIPHPTKVHSVAVYAAYRDRFDDPNSPRVLGGWEKLLVAPLDQFGHLRTWVPAMPATTTVLVGLGEDGKVLKWQSAVQDSEGRSASFYAIAGDHYSGVRANGFHFCLGCHPGHTFIPADIRERSK